jgi:hypothetical protein
MLLLSVGALEHGMINRAWFGPTARRTRLNASRLLFVVLMPSVTKAGDFREADLQCNLPVR